MVVGPRAVLTKGVYVSSDSKRGGIIEVSYHKVLGNKEVKISNGCSTHRSAQVDQRTQDTVLRRYLDANVNPPLLLYYSTTSCWSHAWSMEPPNRAKVRYFTTKQTLPPEEGTAAIIRAFVIYAGTSDYHAL